MPSILAFALGGISIVPVELGAVEPRVVAPLQLSYCQIEQGQVRGLSWIPYAQSGARGVWTPVFDCYGNENRWYISDDPVLHVANDMQTTVGGMGNAAERIEFDWRWGANEHCYVLLETFDGFAACAVSPFDPAGNPITSIVFDFGMLPAAYYYADIDLRGTGLSVGMPSDRCGGYHFTYGRDLVNGELILATFAQPLYTCTGTAANPPEPRPGRDRPCNCVNSGGEFQPADCWQSQLFDFCDWIGPSVRFSVISTPCHCTTDLNCDHVIDLVDLTLLLSQFGAAGCSVADTNTDGAVSIADLTALLSAYGTTCP